jgi:hypothetical protein
LEPPENKEVVIEGGKRGGDEDDEYEGNPYDDDPN